MTTTCTVPFCVRAHQALGLCSTHYNRVRNGTPLSAPIPRAAHDLIEDLEWLLKCGTPPDEAAARSGYPTNVTALARRLYRHGRPDLAAHFGSITYRERHGAA